MDDLSEVWRLVDRAARHHATAEKTTSLRRKWRHRYYVLSNRMQASIAYLKVYPAAPAQDVVDIIIGWRPESESDVA